MKYIRLKRALSFFFVVAIITMTVSCVDYDRLPEPTQTGANMFGCKIDGKYWIPDGLGGFSGIGPVNGGFMNNGIDNRRVINIRTYSRDKQSIQLFLKDIGVGKHPLNRDIDIRPGWKPENYATYNSNRENTFSTSSLHTGYVMIEKSDTTTGVISGRFEFEVGPKCYPASGTHRITQGRFDVGPRNR